MAIRITRVSNKELIEIFSEYFRDQLFRKGHTIKRLETTNEGGLYIYWTDDHATEEREQPQND